MRAESGHGRRAAVWQAQASPKPPANFQSAAHVHTKLLPLRLPLLIHLEVFKKRLNVFARAEAAAFFDFLKHLARFIFPPAFRGETVSDDDFVFGKFAARRLAPGNRLLIARAGLHALG